MLERQADNDILAMTLANGNSLISHKTLLSTSVSWPHCQILLYHTIPLYSHVYVTHLSKEQPHLKHKADDHHPNKANMEAYNISCLTQYEKNAYPLK